MFSRKTAFSAKNLRAGEKHLSFCQERTKPPDKRPAAHDTVSFAKALAVGRGGALLRPMGRCKSAQHSVGADDPVGPINIADSPQISEKALLSVGGQSRPPLQWNGQAFADLPKISEKYDVFCGRAESSNPTLKTAGDYRFSRCGGSTPQLGSGWRCMAPKILLLRSGYCACRETISSLTSCRLVCLSAGQTLWTTGSS